MLALSLWSWTTAEMESFLDILVQFSNWLGDYGNNKTLYFVFDLSVHDLNTQPVYPACNFIYSVSVNKTI